MQLERLREDFKTLQMITREEDIKFIDSVFRNGKSMIDEQYDILCHEDKEVA